MQEYDEVPGWPAKSTRLIKTPLLFTAKWYRDPLWKRALIQRGSIRATGKR